MKNELRAKLMTVETDINILNADDLNPKKK